MARRNQSRRKQKKQLRKADSSKQSAQGKSDQPIFDTEDETSKDSVKRVANPRPETSHKTTNRRKNSLPPGRRSKNESGQDFIERMVLPVGRSGWAIAAGYLGLFSLILIPAPLAVIVSIIAIRDISNSKGRARPKHGMGRAVFGLLAGLFGCFLLLLILAAGGMG